MGPSRCKTLDLANGHAALGNAAREAKASLRIIDGEQGTRVARREASLFQKVLNWRFEFQQAHGVSDGGSVFAGAFSHLFLGKMELVDEALKGVSLFNGIEIFALEIFDQRHFECE